MKRGLVLLALVAASVAATGCGGTAVTDIGGAAIVPASVAAFVAIDSDPDSEQWRQADELAQRFPGRADAVAQLEDSLRSDSGLDFDNDVKPALGPELDLVWLDLERNGENVVALLQPEDEAAFEQAIARGNAKDPDDRLLYEEVDGWQVLSNRQETIDAFRAAVEAGGPVLADDESFEQAMDDYESSAVVKAYLSGARVMEKLRATAPADQEEFLDKLGTLDWLALSLRTTSDGVRVDTTVRGTPGSLFRSADGAAAPEFELALPKELPADVLAYIGFHGGASTFSGLEDNPALQSSGLEPVRSMLRKIGVLIDGENALYVRASDGDLPEVTLVTEPREGADGAARLDGILADADVDDEVERAQIAGTDARRIRFGDAFEIAYANVGERLVVTTSPAGIEALAHPGETLDDARSFKEAVDASGAPSNVQSFVYVDVRGGVDLVERLSDAPIPDSIRREVGPLHSIVEYVASRPSEVQLTLFVRIDERA